MQNNEFADNVKKTFDTEPRVKAAGFNHSFDVGIAISCGVEAAIIFNNLLYWLIHNNINGINQINGKTWTYDSVEKMQLYVPYLSCKQIRNAIDKLVEAKILVRGNFHANKMDRRYWYALADETILGFSNISSDFTKKENASDNLGKCILPKGKMQLAKRENDHNTDTIHTDIITSSMVPSEPSAVADEEDSNVPIEKSKKRKNPDYQPLVYEMSAKITALLVKYNPDYRIPKNMSSILAYVKLLTKDYTPERILQVLEWALKDNVERNNFKGWSSVIYGKNPAQKLRTHFSQISKQMASKPDRKFAASSDDERAIAVMEEMTRNAIR